MSNITKAEKSELEAYEASLLSQQAQKFPAKYNAVKLSYDDDKPELMGKFIAIKEGETEWQNLGESFKGIILAKRHQYSWYDKVDKEKFMRTAQFSEWAEPVKVSYEGLKDTVSGIAGWIKERYGKESPKKAVYKAILYVLIGDTVHLLRVGGTSCVSWFKYNEAMDPRSMPFSVVTEFGREKAKNPMGKTYYPMTFKAGEKTDPAIYNDLLRKSLEVSKMIAALENDNPNSTVEDAAGITPEDLPFDAK